MRCRSVLFIIAIVFCYLSSFSQPDPSFRRVDEFKISDAKVKVFFKDPLAVLVSSFPDFDAKPEAEKNRLLQVYLWNHELYIFSVTSGDNKTTSYVVRGNPIKKESPVTYEVDIADGDVLTASNDNKPAPRKTVSDLNLQGEFFEHMSVFQQPRFRKVKTTMVWGNIIRINPYAPIKEAVEKIVQQDLASGSSK